jgi:hypothetical protein
MYSRTGSIVTVSGVLEVNPTAAGTVFTCRISLPVSSNLASSLDVAGVATNYLVGDAGSIDGDTVNDNALLRVIPLGSANQPYYFTFTYRVL